MYCCTGALRRNLLLFIRKSGARGHRIRGPGVFLSPRRLRVLPRHDLVDLLRHFHAVLDGIIHDEGDLRGDAHVQQAGEAVPDESGRALQSRVALRFGGLIAQDADIGFARLEVRSDLALRHADHDRDPGVLDFFPDDAAQGALDFRVDAFVFDAVFLHMPYEVAEELKKNREEEPDGHEKDKNHLIMAELSYIELAHRYHFRTIECASGKKPRSIDEISENVYEIVNSFIKEKDRQKKIN